MSSNASCPRLARVLLRLTWRPLFLQLSPGELTFLFCTAILICAPSLSANQCFFPICSSPSHTWWNWSTSPLFLSVGVLAPFLRSLSLRLSLRTRNLEAVLPRSDLDPVCAPSCLSSASRRSTIIVAGKDRSLHVRSPSTLITSPGPRLSQSTCPCVPVDHAEPAPGHTYLNPERALYVLHHVFSYLDPIHYSDEEISKSRQSLMMAARTCRGFSGPALDVLWKRLPDDQPLVDLLCTIGITDRELKQDDTALLDEHQLPRHEQRLRARRCAEGYDIQYFLQDAGDPRQHPGWPRFVEYATRVHAICLFAFDGPAWCSLWQQLLIATEGAPILPKLVSVAFCNVRTRRAICPEALALVSLSVRTLNFNIKPEGPWTGIDEKTGPLFSQIFETAPEIEQLRLRVLPFRLGAPFFRARCSRLRHLEVGPHLGLEGLSVLTELPTLQYLSISLVDPGRGSSTAPLLTLKSVTTLVMNGRWTALNGALGSMRLPSMRSLVLEGPGYDESAFNLAKGATECFRTIPRHTSITNLSISTKYSPPPDSRGFGYFTWVVEDSIEAPLLDFMHPLLSLSNLRDVSLSFPSFFVLASTSSDLRKIAESWPALETFHLGVSLRRDGHNRRVYQPLSRHPSRDDVNSQSDVSVSDTYRYPTDYAHGAPLEAIAHFARLCPRLRVLRLSAMEMREDSLAAAVALLGSAPAPAEPHGLRTLSIWRVLLPPGRKDLFEKVPKLVGAVFPRVKFPFRAPRRGRDLEDDPEDDEWVYAYACTPRHPVCERERKLTFWP